MADNPWEDPYQAYARTWSLSNRAEAFAERTRLIRQARKLLGRAYRRHAWWVMEALDDAQRKLFVAEVMATNVPHYFFAAMIRAGVHEPDPNAKRRFIVPCVYERGYRAVNEALLPYLEHGTPDERMGAAKALYWASIRDEYFWLTGRVISPRKYVPTPEAQEEYASWASVRARRTALLVRLFHESDDADARLNIIAQLFLDPAQPDTLLYALGSAALEMARQHPHHHVRRRAARLAHLTSEM